MVKSVMLEGSGIPTRSPAVIESIDFSKNAKTNKLEFFSKDIPFFWLSNSSEHPLYVRKAPNPIEAIRIARTYAKEIRPDWIKDGVNVSTMRMVLLTKFTQHTDLRLALLETGDAEIVHASPNDAFWGSAAAPNSEGRGRNMLGRTIMQSRELLRVAAGVGANSGTRTV
ncbi:unnamed protein product [Malassezia sympodialis ATCC 42132]|uniref:uncharacterized protein n=1 Tax=Malassezia sympodialis (strain ATCC 42132) TaxID=1230383 RepID=UPI0002C2A44C|nr:uncharacterized protein MSY001_1237 [Malassezia sympodialis ATCC 42132]CCU98531.1 unnamed protein product [Malassezia sympodialis ATCC 42132]|eukprot:XP_018739834.1 uncharacterized protein MSY001_1237 [Malassezia sympodialis ATCC 42132]